MTFLQKIGSNIDKGLVLLLPFSVMAQLAISIFFPGLGPLIGVITTAIASAESAFKDKPKSGAQKLDYAVTIVEPVIREFVPDGQTVYGIVSKFADILNAFDENGKPKFAVPIIS